MQHPDHPSQGTHPRPHVGPFGAAEPRVFGRGDDEPDTAGHTPRIEQLFDRFEQLEHAVLEGRDDDGPGADLASRLEALEARMAALDARIAAQVLDPPDWLAQILASVEHDDQGVISALADLSDRVDRLAQRPDPQLDLGPQRQALATFLTAGNMFLRRLEAAVASLAADNLHLADRLARTQSEEDRNAALSSAVTGLAATTADLAAVAAAMPDERKREQSEFLADLRMGLAEIAAGIERSRAG